MSERRLEAEAHHNVAEWWHHVSLGDPFDAVAELCIDGRAMIDGLEFDCTGHEHRFGLHTLCSSPIHYHDPADCIADGSA